MIDGRPTPVEKALRPLSLSALVGTLVAALALASAIVAGLGHRFGWWDFPVGFLILRAALFAAIGAAVLCLVGVFSARPGGRRSGLAVALVGIAVALAVVAVPLYQWRIAQRVPRIHDITTDTADPPRFVALLPARRAAPNGADYGGPEVAAKQREAYPEIVPLQLDLPPDQAFERALRVARQSGWNIAAADKAEGRIEATDTTLWFGFRDDIVVRVRPIGKGSRVDVRSMSRVGKSDVGANARRINRYLERVRAAT